MRLLNDWTQHSFRVRNELIPVISYLWHKSTLENCSSKETTEKIISSSLTYIKKINYKVKVQPYGKPRTPKSYSVRMNTLNDMLKVKDILGLKVSEMFEVCIFIYAILNLNKTEQEYLKLHTWGIKLTYRPLIF